MNNQQLMIEIKNRFTGAVIYKSTATSTKDALVEAIASGADLTEANLAEANLAEANLYGANLTGAIEADIRRVLMFAKSEAPLPDDEWDCADPVVIERVFEDIHAAYSWMGTVVPSSLGIVNNKPFTLRIEQEIPK